MAFVMMKPILPSAIMMVEIVVDPISIKSIVLHVYAIVKRVAMLVFLQ